ncbi:MAG: phosphate ABC transporter substrate-binding protein [Oscillospiraceae bacterium]|jgi:phosphate transport system substrate-binding protein|nr:phosphate ABC transporter substrate-binding protein [Oscillospiraceae bacterium]
MKKTLSIASLVVLLVVVGAVLVACFGTPKDNNNDDNAALSGTVKTGGSTSVEKVMNALIYQFQGENRDVTVNYEMNGSGDGIKNTISGLYEIGHSSRELKKDGSEDGLTATAYAIDGIALVVNQKNTTTALTTEQVKDIYTGKIKNWKEVGGADALITVVTREASSGTRSAFAEIVGLEKADAPETAIVANATTCENTGAIQTTVSQNANAIGYMSYSDVDSTKITPLSYNGVAPSEATLKDGTYTLKREFYLVTKTGAQLSPAAQAFADFVRGEDGRKIVAANKLLPIE